MTPDILCIGSVLWDVVGRPDPRVAHRMRLGADLPGRIVRVPGGVALNVATALRRFGMRPALLGVVGRDAEGQALVERCAALGLVTEHLLRADDPTDRFVAIEGPEGVIAAIADTRSLEAAGARILAPLAEGRIAGPWRGPVALDGNLTEALLDEIAGSDLLAGADLRVAPASPGKAARLRRLLGHRNAVIYLNIEEAEIVAERPFATAAEAARALLQQGAARAIVTDGPRRRRRRRRRRPHPRGRATRRRGDAAARGGRRVHGRPHRRRGRGREPRGRAPRRARRRDRVRRRRRVSDAALPLDLGAEVARARCDGHAVVALESSILAHGLPRPLNLEAARAAEAAVREEGAVPATVAVIEGRLKVGLDDAALAMLSRAEGAAKLSRADLAACLATGGTGAMTVAATMIAARAAGIEVFATGGIGGVHRGAAHSFDVSADLRELARTPVTVVCAGAKAILDLPATLEVLETLGVTVIVVGRDVLPAFWSRDSGLPAPLRIDEPAAIARAHRMREALGIEGGQLVANPVACSHEVPMAELAPLIARASREAEARGVRGKAVTPWLLSRLAELTEGRTLHANLALVEGNARLGARIARELGALRRA